jgi:hypothetical protein
MNIRFFFVQTHLDDNPYRHVQQDYFLWPKDAPHPLVGGAYVPTVCVGMYATLAM